MFFLALILCLPSHFNDFHFAAIREIRFFVYHKRVLVMNLSARTRNFINYGAASSLNHDEMMETFASSHLTMMYHDFVCQFGVSSSSRQQSCRGMCLQGRWDRKHKKVTAAAAVGVCRAAITFLTLCTIPFPTSLITFISPLGAFVLKSQAIYGIKHARAL